jgi:hypothetical protein
MIAKKRGSFLPLIAAMLTLTATSADAQSDGEATESPRRQFTFSWQFASGEGLAPRGGTSRGTSVALASEESSQWQHLREAGISDFERDRRAILAMAGDYRTSFDFIETVGFDAQFEPARPYQSWGTERIYVIEDTGDRIALQHIMAMFIRGEGDEIIGPFVQKHWRQEWVYQPEQIHVFVGDDRWEGVPAERNAGRWAQTVYQVDDSPRYAALGTWQHNASYSSWKSDETWRPLPRRESSVRDDYSVLIGTNRHTILPTGWVQEEENLKALLDDSGEVSETTPFVARELGVNRYELIVDFDFSAADEYWHATEAFWSDVRAAWDEIFASRDQFRFQEVVDGVALWYAMFEYAGELESGTEYEARAARSFVDETLARYVE